jgi:MFS family permease
MMGVALILAILTIAGAMSPWMLQALTCALSAGDAFETPAWRATLPELVPKEDLAAASALNGIEFNLAVRLGQLWPAPSYLWLVSRQPSSQISYRSSVSFLSLPGAKDLFGGLPHRSQTVERVLSSKSKVECAVVKVSRSIVVLIARKKVIVHRSTLR